MNIVKLDLSRAIISDTDTNLENLLQAFVIGYGTGANFQFLSTAGGSFVTFQTNYLVDNICNSSDGFTYMMRDTSSNMSIESFDKPIPLAGRIVAILQPSASLDTSFRSDVNDYLHFKLEDDTAVYGHIIIAVSNVSLTESYTPFRNIDNGTNKIKYYDMQDFAGRISSNIGGDAVTRDRTLQSIPLLSTPDLGPVQSMQGGSMNLR